MQHFSQRLHGRHRVQAFRLLVQAVMGEVFVGLGASAGGKLGPPRAEHVTAASRKGVRLAVVRTTGERMLAVLIEELLTGGLLLLLDLLDVSVVARLKLPLDHYGVFLDLPKRYFGPQTRLPCQLVVQDLKNLCIFLPPSSDIVLDIQVFPLLSVKLQPTLLDLRVRYLKSLIPIRRLRNSRRLQQTRHLLPLRCILHDKLVQFNQVLLHLHGRSDLLRPHLVPLYSSLLSLLFDELLYLFLFYHEGLINTLLMVRRFRLRLVQLLVFYRTGKHLIKLIFGICLRRDVSQEATSHRRC